MASAQWRSAGLHLVTFGGGAAAAISFMASHAVDLYAIYDQINVVVREGSKLFAMVAPIASGAYAVYKASTRQKLLDATADPNAPQIAREIPVTPQVVAVANQLKANTTSSGL